MSLIQNIYGSLFVNNNITGNTLTLSSITNDDSLTQILARNNDGLVVYRDVSSLPDTFVTGFTFNNTTYDLTIKQNEGQPDLVSNLAVLATDVYVVSGVYDPTTGIVTYTNSSGGTFQVSGFTTGMTDSYTTDAYLNGTEIRFDNNIQGVNFYNVDLLPLLSGKTDNTTFNTYTANTQTILDGKIDSANNVGGANEFFKDKSGTTLNFRTLSGGSNTTVSTVGDVVKVDVTIPADTNTFVTGFTYNDANTFTISRNDGIDLSASINTVTGLTSNGNVEVIGNLIATGGTGNVLTKQVYVENNLGLDWDFPSSSVVLGNNSDGTIINGTSLTINSDTLVNGTLTATTFYGDGSNLTGIPDNFVTGGTLNSGTLILERQNGTVTITGFTTDLDTYVTGGTVSISATDSDNSGTIGLFYKNSDGIPRTLPFEDTFTTGATYDNGTALATFKKNDGTSYTLNLSSLTGGTSDTNSFSTGGTVTQTATSGSSQVTIQITGNDGFTPYNITGLTDTFVNDFSFSSNTFTISQNDGSTFEADVDTIDLANILSAVTFNIATTGTISATTFNGGTFNGTFVGDGSGLTGITDNDTFVTGFTYNNANTLTIERNDGVNLSTSINTMTGLTVNGTLSATTYFGDGSNLTGISSEDNFVTGGTFSSEILTLNRQNGSVTITGFTSTPSLNNGEIFVGDTGNTAQSVAMTGDVNIDNTGLTTIQPDVVTYDKMQDVTQRAILGSENVSGGTVTEIPVVDQFLTTGTVPSQLSNTSNWDINGNYTGSTISGTFQSQMYYDGNYFFIAVLDNTWIRLIRG